MGTSGSVYRSILGCPRACDIVGLEKLSDKSSVLSRARGGTLIQVPLLWSFYPSCCSTKKSLRMKSAFLLPVTPSEKSGGNLGEAKGERQKAQQEKYTERRRAQQEKYTERRRAQQEKYTERSRAQQEKYMERRRAQQEKYTKKGSTKKNSAIHGDLGCRCQKPGQYVAPCEGCLQYLLYGPPSEFCTIIRTELTRTVTHNYSEKESETADKY
ncbi:hypothetical protein NDU88_002609 [Pleurodeles waltl]|uniref:Uncharacterized protein n=1 Tax=Pleurodeles waltl TaxID=8319 RepID=A0AAV7WLQ7_PLEWA|nr:hypothetical protein NDU88_002609 [Pleurodeles waltl]